MDSGLTAKEHCVPSGRSVLAPHHQANAKAGASKIYKFFMIYMKMLIEMVFVFINVHNYFLVHDDLFTNSLTSMLRFQIILHHFKKLNKFFKRYIIINKDFRNIETIELSIEMFL